MARDCVTVTGSAPGTPETKWPLPLSLSPQPSLGRTTTTTALAPSPRPIAHDAHLYRLLYPAAESVRPLSRPPPSPIALENRRAKLTLHCPYSEDLARVSSRIMAGSRRDAGSARRVTTAGGESDSALSVREWYGAYNPRDFKRRRAL